MSTTIKPGVETPIVLATKQIQGPYAAIEVKDVWIKADACGGQVNLRPYAIATVSTSAEDEQIPAYGAPKWM